MAIQTTDTFIKHAAYEFELGGKTVKIAGIAKGAGMIHPNMATMLTFLTTDAAVAPDVLNARLRLLPINLLIWLLLTAIPAPMTA